ncbi:hypothetical protein ACFQZC_29955 [Streptacidiphilus monticola]
MEFTTEPFDMDGFPEHAKAARRVVDEAGLEVEVGPFGTSAEGPPSRCSPRSTGSCGRAWSTARARYPCRSPFWRG